METAQEEVKEMIPLEYWGQFGMYAEKRRLIITSPVYISIEYDERFDVKFVDERILNIRNKKVDIDFFKHGGMHITVF